MLTQESHELEKNKETDYTKAFAEYMAAVTGKLPTETIGICRLAGVYLDYAIRLFDSNCSSRAFEEIQKAHQLLLGLVGSTSTLENALPRQWLYLEMTILLTDSTNGMYRYNKIRTLSRRAIQQKEYEIYRKLTMSALKAAQDLGIKFWATESDSTTATGKGEDDPNILISLLNTESFVSYSAIYASLCITRYCTLKKSSIRVFGQECFDILIDFFQRFPDLDLPGVRFDLLRYLLQVSIELKLRKDEEIYRKKLLEARKGCPPRFGLELLELPELDDFTAELLWGIDAEASMSLNPGRDFTERIIPEFGLVCATLIIRWVCWDLDEGHLRDEEAMKLLHWDEHLDRGLGTMSMNKTEHTSNSRFSEEILASLSPVELSHYILGIPEPRVGSDWETWIASVEQWLTQAERKPSLFQRLMVLRELSRIHSMHVSDYIALGISDIVMETMTPLWATEVQSQLDQAIRLSNIDDQLISTDRMMYLKYSQANSKLLLGSISNGTLITDDELKEAESSLQALREEATARGNLLFIYRANWAIARNLKMRFNFFRSVEPWESLPWWTAVEELERTLWMEHSTLDPVRRFQARQKLNEIFQQDTCRKEAIAVCLDSFLLQKMASPEKKQQYSKNPEYLAVGEKLQIWMERSKARALSEILGSSAEPTLELKKLLQEDAGTKTLWDRRESLLASMKTCSAVEKRPTKEKVQILTEELREKSSTVAAYLDIMEGRPINSAELLRFSRELGPSVVFVKWFEVPRGRYRDWDILMMVIRNGKNARY